MDVAVPPLLCVAAVATGLLLRHAAWAGVPCASSSRVMPVLVAAAFAAAHHYGTPRGTSQHVAVVAAAAAWACVTLGRRLQTTGLTGSIATGKSTVARMLAARGAVLVDADALARAAVAPGTLPLRVLTWRLGRGILAPDGSLDRPALRSRIARDPAARVLVNSVVHPSIAARLLCAVAWHRWACGRPVVLDLPLLYETGGPLLRALVWPVMVVSAPEEARLARLLARDYASATRDAGAAAAAEAEAEARALIAAQWPQAAKVARGNVELRNDGGVAQLGAAVDEVWHARLAGLP